MLRKPKTFVHQRNTQELLVIQIIQTYKTVTCGLLHWSRGYLKIITLESIGLLLNADNIYASKTVDMFNLARVCWLGNLKLTCICSQSIAK